MPTFTLKSLFVLTLIVGVLVAWSIDRARFTERLERQQKEFATALEQRGALDRQFRIAIMKQRRLNRHLDQTKLRLARATDEVECYERRKELLTLLDETNPRHQQVFKELRSIRAGTSAESAPVDSTNSRGLRVIILRYSASTGNSRSSAFLIQAGAITDWITRESCPGTQYHESFLWDVDGDGLMELAFHYQAGVYFAYTHSTEFTDIYEICERGFVPKQSLTGDVRRVSDEPSDS